MAPALAFAMAVAPAASSAQDTGAAMAEATEEARAQVVDEEEEAKRPMTNVAELALVQTTGNSETFTFSLQDTFVRNWERSSLTIAALVLRTESTDRQLVNDGGVVTEVSESEVTGDKYALSFRYDRLVSERTGWFGLGGWERNRPAGIENRSHLDGGLSHVFVDSDVQSWLGQAGFGYTVEEPVGGERDEYPTARLYTSYRRALSETSSFDVHLEAIENLDDTDDYRINFLAGVTAKLTGRLALRVSYTVNYDNVPVSQVVAGDDPGEPDGLFVFDETDTILAASLVVDF
jgi:putative salt-induced outer membrane protein YdiY